tara:strand:- start:937 stop:1242 length:306 start_codon:yes stop_codon:yes gene_type:complete
MPLQQLKFKSTLNNSLFILIATLSLLTTSYVQAHSGPLNEIAIKVCDTKKRSQACQYEGGHNDLYIGSCQYMSTTLMCVRSQPIQIIDDSTTHHEKEKHSD